MPSATPSGDERDHGEAASDDEHEDGDAAGDAAAHDAGVHDEGRQGGEEDPDLYADADVEPPRAVPPPAAVPRPEPPPSQPPPATGPLALSDGELRAKVVRSMASLGPISVGRPSAGALVNGVMLACAERCKLSDPGRAWGTQETVDNIVHAIGVVQAQFPGTPPLAVGHLSARRGGSLAPHRSHQSGRDVDLGYYYVGNVPFYTRATALNLDVPRTWALVRTFVTDSDVEYLFIDTPLQRILKEHALASGEDPAWLDDIFQHGGTGQYPIIRHVHGHDTHIHARFFNAVAQELGRRVHPHLVARGLVQPRTYHTAYRAKKGDTLAGLAKRFGVSAEAIRKANRLRNKRLVKGRTYLIPRRGNVVVADSPVRIPARRLPRHEPARDLAGSP